MTATINASTTAGVVTTADTSGILQLQTNGTAALTVDASQNVGIGITSPTRKLAVSGTWTNTGDYLMDSGSPQLAWTSGDLRFKTGGLSGTEVVRIDSSGNVGIGTTSPVAASLLTLKKTSAGGDGAELRLINSSTTVETATQIVFTNTTTDSGNSAVIKVARTSGGQDFRFASDGTERVRINSSGSTFFNCTASPTSNSSGPGGLNALVSSGDVFNIKHTADGNNVFNIWQTGTASFNAITFFKGGSQTGIGQILGTTSSTAYQTSSDYRLKENITPMTGALDKVAQLKPVTYKWKVDGSDGQGFIAHELQAVVPDCVSGEKDQVNEDGSIKPQGIDTSFLVATLTAAIQELKAIVDAQGAEIAAQGAEIAALKGATA